MRALAAFLFAALASTAGAAASAQIGVTLPYLGGGYFHTGQADSCAPVCVAKAFFNPHAMSDIRALGATFVRTGWVPGFYVRWGSDWHVEDREMRNICNSGLKLALLVPGYRMSPLPPTPGAPWTMAQFVQNVRDFFTRYTARYPGCIVYAELDNEADLPANGYANVDDYASYYETVAPIVKSFGIPVVTSGTSGEDIPWTMKLARLLAAANAPVDGYGYHPYGVHPEIGSRRGKVTSSIEAMAAAAGVDPSHIYITELGVESGPQLQWAMIQSAAVSPFVAVYTYYVYPPYGDTAYALTAHPELLNGFKSALSALEGEAAP